MHQRCNNAAVNVSSSRHWRLEISIFFERQENNRLVSVNVCNLKKWNLQHFYTCTKNDRFEMYRNNVVTFFFCFDASLFSWLGNQSFFLDWETSLPWLSKTLWRREPRSQVKKKQLHSRAEKLYIYIYYGNWIDQARARSYKTWFDRPVVQLCCQNFEIVSRNKTQESHLSPPQCFSHVPETCFRVGFLGVLNPCSLRITAPRLEHKNLIIR